MAIPTPPESGGKQTCGAKTRRGTRCTRPAGWGTDHAGIGACKLHLGSTLKNRRAAARRLIDRDARRILSEWGEPQPLVDPVRRLQLLAGEADLWLSVCRAQVDQLEEFTAWTPMQGEMVRAMVVQYTDAMERVHRMAADLVRLGLEERAQKLEEAQSRLVWDAVDRGLRAGLAGTPELYGAVRSAIGVAVAGMMAELGPAVVQEVTS